MKMKLTNVRLAFPTLFTPETFDGTGAPRYGCSLLVSKEDTDTMDKVKEAIDEVGSMKWGKKWEQERFRKSVKLNAWRDGDEKDYEGFPGHMYISANRAEKNGPPTVVDADRTPLTERSGRPYGGCYVNAVVSFYADDRYGVAINCGLAGIQFYRDGASFGGAEHAEAEDFDDVSEGAELLG